MLLLLLLYLSSLLSHNSENLIKQKDFKMPHRALESLNGHLPIYLVLTKLTISQLIEKVAAKFINYYKIKHLDCSLNYERH